jgi:hypothetical protein
VILDNNFRRTLAVALLGISALAMQRTAAAPETEPTPNPSVELRASGGSRWYRGNTHAHTLWSDGDAAPELVVAWYKEEGYQFLCLSDHNILLDATTPKWQPITESGHLTPQRVQAIRKRFGKDWVDETDRNQRRYMRLKTLPELRRRFDRPGEFTLISAEEITSYSPDVHVNGINVREFIPAVNDVSSTTAILAALDAIQEQSKRLGVPMLGHINHPNWGRGITAEEIIAAGGERFFEVYNGHPRVRNHGSEKRHMPSTDRLWDIILSMRLREHRERPLYGLATDDAHAYYEQGLGLENSGRGWIMVLAGELSPTAIVEAMQAGRFYASSGVTLNAVSYDRKQLRIEIEPMPDVTYTVQFIGTRQGFDADTEAVLDSSSKPVKRATLRYSDEIGIVLGESTSNPAVYSIQGNELYVRARVVASSLTVNPAEDGDHPMAWTQPVVIAQRANDE